MKLFCVWKAVSQSFRLVIHAGTEKNASMIYSHLLLILCLGAGPPGANSETGEEAESATASEEGAGEEADESDMPQWYHQLSDDSSTRLSSTRNKRGAVHMAATNPEPTTAAAGMGDDGRMTMAAGDDALRFIKRR